MIVDEQATSTSTIELKNVIISNPEGYAVEIEVINATVEILRIDGNDGIDEGIVDNPDYDPDYELVDPIFSETNSTQYWYWDYFKTVLSISWMYY